MLSGIGQALHKVLGDLRAARQSSVEEVLGKLAERYTWYQGKSQQDAHEFLRTLLGALGEKEKDSLHPIRSFQGYTCEAVLCWSCRQISLRQEMFLDLSLDIHDMEHDEPGPLGLHGWIMKPRCARNAVDVEEPVEIEPEPDAEAKDEFGDAVIEVQLERAPGRRVALGFEWADEPQHDRNVLRRVLPGTMADQWNKRQGGRLVPGLLLLSVNGEEDRDEIMQVLKDEQKLLFRFLPEEIMNAQRGKGAACAANGFQVELAKDSTSKAWGFQLSSEGGALVVSQILPDSVLDAWNLRCRSTGRQGLIVHAGDRVLSVNGKTDDAEMSKALSNPARRKNLVVLEPGDRQSAPVRDKQDLEDDATFDIELHPLGTAWGFQLEEPHETGAKVKGIDGGSPLALWNTTCLSRGDEHLCVEAGDVLLDSADVPMAGSRTFKLRRAKERQASLGALRAAAVTKSLPSLPEERRLALVQAASECTAALAEPLAEIFSARTESLRLVTLADCVRHLGSVEALEEDFLPIYKCPQCEARSFASKRSWLRPPLPHVLPVQLKRFHRQNGSFQKSRTRVQTSCTLDLKDLLLSAEEAHQLQAFAKSEAGSLLPDHELQTSYELYAVCAHLGRSMECGHYIAFINTGPSLQHEAWFLLDDAQTLPCRREDVLRAEAYIAFYRKANGS
ncbi:unnamed protein product [Effrenium voratum]|nr:unnamed protein product [Effrenium voratum]